MHRIDHLTAVDTPDADAAGPNPDYYFTDGDPVGGIPATVVTPSWLNDIQENIMSVLSAASITPVKNNYGQLLAAINAIIGNKGYTHTQGSASTTWNINHNLGTKAHITQLMDDNDEVFQAQIQKGINTDVVTLTEAMSGEAHLIAVG